MKTFPVSNYVDNYLDVLDKTEHGLKGFLVIVIIPILAVAGIIIPFVSAQAPFLGALAISTMSALALGLLTKGEFYPHYWITYLLPAFIVDLATYPFRAFCAKFLSSEVRGSRLLISLIEGRVDSKKIQPQLIECQASVLTKSLVQGACVEFVRDQIGRSPLDAPIGPNVQCHERIEIVNEQMSGKVAYVHFEVECRTKVGSTDECKGAHFFARFELCMDGMKIKRPDVTWVCDLDSKKATSLELAEGFARFIDERDSEDPLCLHDPRRFMLAAKKGLAQSCEDGVGSVASSVRLESE